MSSPCSIRAGYLTIKDCDRDFGVYSLDIPNREVRVGLMESLIPSYITKDTLTANTTVVNLARFLSRDDMDGAPAPVADVPLYGTLL